MTAATTPATDAEIEILLRLLKSDLPPWSDSSNTILSLIARIHQEREQAIRECAALFETAKDEPVGDITKLMREASRQNILALLPMPPALSQEERT